MQIFWAGHSQVQTKQLCYSSNFRPINETLAHMWFCLQILVTCKKGRVKANHTKSKWTSGLSWCEYTLRLYMLKPLKGQAWRVVYARPHTPLTCWFNN